LATSGFSLDADLPEMFERMSQPVVLLVGEHVDIFRRVGDEDDVELSVGQQGPSIRPATVWLRANRRLVIPCQRIPLEPVLLECLRELVQWLLYGADVFGIAKSVLGLAEHSRKSGDPGAKPLSHAIGKVGLKCLDDGSHMVTVGFPLPRMYCRLGDTRAKMRHHREVRAERPRADYSL